MRLRLTFIHAIIELGATPTPSPTPHRQRSSRLIDFLLGFVASLAAGAVLLYGMPVT